MQPLLTTAAVILSLVIALMVVYYLWRVIQALKSITAKLDAASDSLFIAASQTDPAPNLVGGIAGNVTTLSNAVNGVARSLGLVK
jgi:hypothetical protein